MLTLNRQHVDPGMSDCSEALLCTSSPCSLACLLRQPLLQTQFSAGSHQLFTSVLCEHCAEACAAHVVPTLVLLPLAVGAHGGSLTRLNLRLLSHRLSETAGANGGGEGFKMQTQK